MDGLTLFLAPTQSTWLAERDNCACAREASSLGLVFCSFKPLSRTRAPTVAVLPDGSLSQLQLGKESENVTDENTTGGQR